MDCQRSVLVVDRSQETREVLQTALERRGVRTLSAGRTEKGVELARRHQPDLIVLDLELDDSSDCLPVGQAFFPVRGCPGSCASGELLGQDCVERDTPIFADTQIGAVPPVQEQTGTKPPVANGPESTQYQPRMILLGNLRGCRDRLPEGEFVSKPYHYGPLIRKIEELLACVNTLTPPGEFGSCQRCLSSAEPIRAHASN